MSARGELSEAHQPGPVEAPTTSGEPMGSRPSRRAPIGAFIDLGTNSVRLVLVRFDPEGGHSVISQVKEVVRLGEGEFIDQHLQPEAMQRAALVCQRFVDMARASGAGQIEAIATSATREARNQQDFLEMLREEAQLEMRVISGREEARLIYLGVSSGLHLDRRKALFIDIGGGSTEVIVGDQHEPDYLSSMKLGAIRLSSMFFLPDETGPVADDRYALIKRYVQNAAVRSIQRIRETPFDLAMGSSGTIENLADIVVKRFEGRPREREDRIQLDQLRQVTQHLRGLPLEARREVPGINPARADIIVAGAAIIETLMEELGIETLQVSDRGLREGLIVDELMQRSPEHFGVLNVRERSVLELGRACGFDEAHARTVRRLSTELFDSAREVGLIDLGDEAREVLRHAALLHDIGAMLSYSSHERHTYYLVRHADLLGFDQAEIALIAAVARFHRKGFPRKKHEEYAVLGPEDRRQTRPLAVLLRLAEGLDRSHAALIDQVRFNGPLEADRAQLDIRSRDGDCHLEVWGVLRQRQAFQRAFGRELQVLVDGDLVKDVDR